MNKSNTFEVHKRAIEAYIENNWGNATIIDAWNEYICEESGEDYVHENDEYFFRDYYSENAYEAVRAAHFGHYSYSDDYVVFNGYGNLDSFDMWDDEHSPIVLGAIATYIIEGHSIGGDIDADEIMQVFIENVCQGENADEQARIISIIEDSEYDIVCDNWDTIIEHVEDTIAEEDNLSEDEDNLSE